MIREFELSRNSVVHIRFKRDPPVLAIHFYERAWTNLTYGSRIRPNADTASMQDVAKRGREMNFPSSLQHNPKMWSGHSQFSTGFLRTTKDCKTTEIKMSARKVEWNTWKRRKCLHIHLSTCYICVCSEIQCNSIIPQETQKYKHNFAETTCFAFRIVIVRKQ